MKWHYDYIDEVVFPDSSDIRNGKYLVYNIDTFDYLMNEPEWVFNNHAEYEQDYILDFYQYHLESEDGELIYIPDSHMASRLETRDQIKEMEFYLDSY